MAKRAGTRTRDERDTRGEDTSSPARRAVAYREAFLDVITAADVRAIGAALLERAKAGELAAAKLVLDRALGTAPVPDWPSRAQAENDAMFAENFP